MPSKKSSSPKKSSKFYENSNGLIILVLVTCIILMGNFEHLAFSAKKSENILNFPQLQKPGQTFVNSTNLKISQPITQQEIEEIYPKALRNQTLVQSKIYHNIQVLKEKCVERDKITPSRQTEHDLMQIILSRNLSDSFLKLMEENRNQYLLCDVPKVGTTNFKKIVLKGEYPDRFGHIPMADIIRPHSQLYGEGGYKYLLDSLLTSPADIQTMTQKFTTFSKILFVRHPFDRILSAFRDKILPKIYENQMYSNIIKTLKKSNSKSSLQKLAAGAFHEFVEYLILLNKIKKGRLAG